MVIGINITTHYKGGAIQVAFSVIEELSVIDKDNRFIVFCLEELYSQLVLLNLPSNFELIRIESSPAKIWKRNQIVALLDQLVRDFAIQVVLTIFGPSYWKPNVPHISGFADGWCYNPSSLAYDKLTFIGNIKRRLLNFYKIYYIKKDCELFFVETEDAKIKFAVVSGISESLIFVCGNTYNSFYHKFESQSLILPERIDGEKRFLLLSANHPNKNISIINHVVPLLRTKIEKFSFITTIPQSDYDQIFSPQIKSYVINTGQLSVKSCAQLYTEIDYTFLPTLLETFTATYPESMIMQKPILTSDLSFARDICKDAALYFNPLSPENIVDVIYNLLCDDELNKRLVNNGLKRVSDFPSANERAQMLLDLCLKYDAC